MRRAINSIVYDLTGSASNQFVSMLTIIGKAYKIITRTFFKVMSTHLILKRSFTYFCIYALIFAPWMSLRAETGITVDPNASAANQSIMDKTANNTPLQNIATPNAAGLSHNKFLKFNVGKKGLVVNNSKALTTSTHLGGIISANPNLKNSNAATIILNEVNGSARTNLLGPTEIAGQRADYIVANPNGISCNGCGFINTPRATLSTGVPELDSNGMLKSFNVNRGDVIISGSGLNALGQGDVTGADIVDIVARQIKINADAALQAKELNIIAGRNQVNYETREAVAKADNGTSVDNAIEIDSSLLGGMYADKITIVATEAGVGVRNDGTMSAGIGGLTLSADGKISINNRIESKANINTASHSSDIEINGTTYAKEKIEVKADNGLVSVEEKSILASNSEVAIDAQNLNIGLDAVIGSGLSKEGTWEGEGMLTIGVNETINNKGRIASIKNLHITSAKTINNEGFIEAVNDLTIENTGQLNNHHIILSGNQLTTRATELTNEGGLFGARKDILMEGTADGMRATSIINNGGTIESLDGDITLRADLIENRNPVELDVEKIENVNKYLNIGRGNVPVPPFYPGYTDAITHAQLSDGGQTKYYTYIANPEHFPDIYDWGPRDWEKYAPPLVTYDPEKWAIYVPDEEVGVPSDASLNIVRETDVISGEYRPGTIINTQDIIIEAKTLLNDKSLISAGKNLEIVAEEVINIGAELRQDLSLQNSFGTPGPIFMQGWVKMGRFEPHQTTEFISSKILGEVPSVIAGQDNLDINANTLTSQNGIETESASGEEDSLRLKSRSFTDSASTIVEVTRGESNFPNGTDIKFNQQLEQTIDGFFQPAPDNSEYLFETRFPYTNEGSFYGSNYFLSRLIHGPGGNGLPYDIHKIPTRLGDAR